MTTPEGSDPARGIPAELAPGAQQLPTPGSATGVASPPAPPTPGIALAAARVPGSPTLPEWDPASLGRLIAEAANQLFTAPPGAPPISPGLPSGVATPGSGAAPIAPAPGAAITAPDPAASAAPAAATLPSAAVPATTPASPFAIAPSFDAVALVGGTDGEAFVDLLRFPLVDVPLAETTAPSAPDGSAAPDGPERALSFGDAQELDVLSAPALVIAPDAFDAAAVRREFPILHQPVNGKRLVWLDNAATTQKPRAVIDRLSRFYEHENSNIHRAAHTLAARATEAYESAREATRRFLGASSAREIVFVRGATEGINLVANSWGRRNVGAGDEVVLTHLEHHANIVPWQMLCAAVGARLRVAPVDDRGQIILDEYERLLGPKTRIVALPQVSNALGTVTPAGEMVKLAHRHGARVLVDGAQAVSHLPVNVQALDCDFYVFSGHKVFAPTGIGAVYGKREVLDAMPPWQGGGNMIEDVTFEQTRYQPPPARFEAGTGNIADAVGLGTALDWLTRLGLPNVARHEHDLLVYATEHLLGIPGLRIVGTAPDKAGVISFVIAGHRPEDVASYLDREGIAVRGGHHCAQPILRRFGLESTVRASFAPYNLCEDVDALVGALRRLTMDSPPAR